MISLIAAIGKNNELGKDNTLLWHMPADMKRFKEITLGHTVIMGRKTFESLGRSPTGEPGRPLPNRKNIVITRDKNYLRHGVNVAYSLEEATKSVGEKEIFIIGGAEIYKQAISLADKLYITHIEADDEDADVFFPAIDSTWKKTFKEEHEKDDKNPFKYTFVNYEKI